MMVCNINSLDVDQHYCYEWRLDDHIEKGMTSCKLNLRSQRYAGCQQKISCRVKNLDHLEYGTVIASKFKFYDCMNVL